jgi:hypothetical protein
VFSLIRFTFASWRKHRKRIWRNFFVGQGLGFERGKYLSFKRTKEVPPESYGMAILATRDKYEIKLQSD